jgi:hypothetical protein
MNFACIMATKYEEENMTCQYIQRKNPKKLMQGLGFINHISSIRHLFNLRDLIWHREDKWEVRAWFTAKYKPY